MWDTGERAEARARRALRVGELDIQAALEAPFTSAGAGSDPSGKAFAAQVSVETANEPGDVVRFLSEGS